MQATRLFLVVVFLAGTAMSGCDIGSGPKTASGQTKGSPDRPAAPGQPRPDVARPPASTPAPAPPAARRQSTDGTGVDSRLAVASARFDQLSQRVESVISASLRLSSDRHYAVTPALNPMRSAQKDARAALRRAAGLAGGELSRSLREIDELLERLRVETGRAAAAVEQARYP